MLTEFSFWENFPFNDLMLLCYRDLNYKVVLSSSVEIQKKKNGSFALWPIKQKAEERHWRLCLWETDLCGTAEFSKDSGVLSLCFII